MELVIHWGSAEKTSEEMEYVETCQLSLIVNGHGAEDIEDIDNLFKIQFKLPAITYINNRNTINPSTKVLIFC